VPEWTFSCSRHT